MTRKHSGSRSPRGAEIPVSPEPGSPESPTDSAWHDSKPGPGSSLDEVRFWSIREVGKLQETARFTGKHLRVLMNEMDAMKKQASTKAEATSVVTEFDRLRHDFQTEVTSVRTELDAAGTEAKLTSVNDLIANLNFY